MSKHLKANNPLKALKRIIENNIFMLKIAKSVAPEVIFVPVLLSFVASVTQFISGIYILRFAINGYQDGKSFKDVIIPICFYFGAIIAVNLGASAYYSFRMNVLNVRFTEHIRKIIFKKNEEVELACYEDKQFYDKLVKASNDIENRFWQVINSITQCVTTVTSLSLNTFFILTIDPLLFVFAVFPAVISITLGKKRNAIQHEYDMKRQEQERQRDYTKRTFYLNDFAKEMRLTNIYKVMFLRFDKAVNNIIEYIKVYGFKLAAIDYIINESLEVVSQMGAILYSAYCTLVTRTMQYGDCLVIINSISTISYTISTIADKFIELHKNSLYIDTIREYLDYEPKIKGGKLDAPAKGDLELKNVTFRYQGQDADVLKNVSIKVKHGERIALVGHNGAGKSTIVKLMLRLYDPTDGEIEYAGKNIKEYTLFGDGSYRKRLSSVFQDFKLFSMTVAENVLLSEYNKSDEGLVVSALKDSGVYEKVSSFENGIQTVLTREFDDKGEVLSGGESQKISIARAFTKDSEIVILDEPSSALDPIAEYKMYESMMKATQNRSVVFISHRLSSAVLADRIYLLENGMVVEEGSHKELMAKNGKYAELFNIQAQNYVDAHKAEVTANA